MPNLILISGKDSSKLLFWGIVLTYIRLYAPYGINDTDGGFISAHAWRLCNGELLYQDNIYIRPPLSILLRYLELLLVPENWALFAERVFFYLKVALYSYLGAGILYKGNRLWYIATLAFIVSVHAYPAAAWHTIDGILFSVTAFYVFFKREHPFFAGLLVVTAMLCKQSFYPLAPLFLLFVFLLEGKKAALKALAGILSGMIVYIGILAGLGNLDDFIFWTQGSSNFGQAIQHGIRDYFSIHFFVLGWSIWLLPLFWKHKYRKYCWYIFLAGLIFSFGYGQYRHQGFSIPISQSRILFLLSGVYLLIRVFRDRWYLLAREEWRRKGRFFFTHAALLAISWMAAISWGYAFPILFALPWVALADAFTRELEWGTSSTGRGALRALLLLSLLLVFRYSYEFVYRDGRRSQMKYEMSAVFPKLKGIRSSQETYDKYSELKVLKEQYGPVFKTLPSFPLANYLTNTASPFPLDWVISVETNQHNEALLEKIEEGEIVFFIEKEFEGQIKGNPRYEVTEYVMEHYQQVEETLYFYVYSSQ